MPYKLRKAPNRNLYWVVTSETGKKHSKEPIALEKAKAQMRILEKALVGGTIPRNVAQQFINILEEVPRRLNLENDLRVLYNALPVEDRHKVDLMVQNMSYNEFEIFANLLNAGIPPEDVQKITNWFYEDSETDDEESSKSKRRKIRGGLRKKNNFNGRAKPSNDIFQKIAVESYAINPKKSVDGWELVSFTPTLKFYRKGSDIVVGVRGTADLRDTRADLSLSYNGLTGTDRFKEDVKVLTQFQNQYPDMEYYGVGHSLGGAVLDELIKLGLIKSGISYNPAVQPQNFRADIPNHRIYEEGDPLYALSGMFLKNKPEVRKKPFSAVGYLMKKVNPVSAPVGYLAAHGLDNFKGGKFPYRVANELKEVLKNKYPKMTIPILQATYDATNESLRNEYDEFAKLVTDDQVQNFQEILDLLPNPSLIRTLKNRLKDWADPPPSKPVVPIRTVTGFPNELLEP